MFISAGAGGWSLNILTAGRGCDYIPGSSAVQIFKTKFNIGGDSEILQLWLNLFLPSKKHDEPEPGIWDLLKNRNKYALCVFRFLVTVNKCSNFWKIWDDVRLRSHFEECFPF